MARKKGDCSDILLKESVLTDCICPRCKKKHQVKLFWTGQLPARKFCLSCLATVNKIGDNPHCQNKNQGYARPGQP